jgi:hypothetical protein
MKPHREYCKRCLMPYNRTDATDERHCHACRKELSPCAIGYTIIYDPLGSIAGFRVGAYFPKDEAEEMRKTGTFTEKTLLKDKKGRVFMYMGNRFWQQKDKSIAEQPSLMPEALI